MTCGIAQRLRLQFSMIADAIISTKSTVYSGKTYNKGELNLREQALSQEPREMTAVGTSVIS